MVNFQWTMITQTQNPPESISDVRLRPSDFMSKTENEETYSKLFLLHTFITLN